MQPSANLRSTILLGCGLAMVVGIVVWNVRKKLSFHSKTKERQSDTKKSRRKSDETMNLDNSTNNSVNSETDRENVATATVTNIEEKTVEEERKDTTTKITKTIINKEISDIPELKWTKVGEIKELYFYPLKSGRGKEVQECKFSEYGISVESTGMLTLRDRMFLVYSEETKRFQTGRQYPTMILVNLQAVDKYRVKLEAVGTPSVVFRVPSSNIITKNNSNNPKETTAVVECTMWFGETVKCIDCGSDVAEWLSRFLTGTNRGLRLGYAPTDRRKLANSPWEKYREVYNTLRDEDVGLFSDLTSYMLMTSQSLDNLNKKLEIPVPALQFRPNIVVSGLQQPFAEDNWEWIKIGERAIIRNVKPCTRYRLLQDSEKIKLEGNVPHMGIYCGLYVTGRVKLGDDVFVHVPDDSSTTSNKNSKSHDCSDENSKAH